MGVSRYPSVVTMPEIPKPYPTILNFLAERFPNVSRETWARRLEQGKILDEDGIPITTDTEYAPLKRLHYFREIRNESVIPFREEIIFQNEDLLVACKPHFLPVVPAGRYVDECLLHRLRDNTGNDQLTPIHRIDRETAGIVLFSTRQKSRGLYQQMFMTGQVRKSYQALSELTGPLSEHKWVIESRIVRGEPWFRMKTVPGEPNSRSEIILEGTRESKALFRLHPTTGKKHQLRIHMSDLGLRIINDRYYPELLPEQEDDFDNPLQLIAQKIEFRDPITGQDMTFTSKRKLSFW